MIHGAEHNIDLVCPNITCKTAAEQRQLEATQAELDSAFIGIDVKASASAKVTEFGIEFGLARQRKVDIEVVASRKNTC
jgi:hypothetical protein